MAKSPENPVGPNISQAHTKWPLWKVSAILFGGAIILTAYKLYEQQFIAPHREVPWQPFSVRQFNEARRQNRSILILVSTSDDAAQAKLNRAMDSPEFRKTMYLTRIAALRVPHSEALNLAERREGDLVHWINKNINSIKTGGFAFFDVDPREPTKIVHANVVTTDRLLALFPDK